MRNFRSKVSRRSSITACFGCVLLAIMLANTVNCQQMQSHSNDLPYAKDPSNLPRALNNLKAGHYSANDVELVARMGSSQAIPDLELLFRTRQDPEDKQKIANGLVRLGTPDDTYWNYLAARAADVINRAVPDPFRYDSHGKVVPDKPSDAFTSWASRNKLDVRTAFNKIVIGDLGSIMELASSGDQRAIPLLRKALSLPNCLLQAEAADGLADLHDQGAIQLIISASSKEQSKDGCAATIAESLVYFDDADAQHAVDLYVPPETARIAREHRAKGYGPFD